MKKYWAIKDGYLANRDGNIYNLNWKRTGTMRKVKQHKQTAGYLYFNKNNKPYLVHRFIAELFLPNPNNLPEINHKDENKLNNCVDNLEWCTYGYNNSYGTARIRARAKRSKRVSQYTMNGEWLATYFNAETAEKISGTTASNIHDCCKGKRKYSKGYIWKYEE